MGDRAVEFLGNILCQAIDGLQERKRKREKKKKGGEDGISLRFAQDGDR